MKRLDMIKVKKYKHIFGPVPSRRMGVSIGISPIPDRVCNYACVYCQLGRTKHMTNERQEFFEVQGILKEFREYLKSGVEFDVVTVVGEGEPTLYSSVGELIRGLKKLTKKPVAVITNGGLLSVKRVREELKNADIVLPSFDAPDEETFKKVNRPYGKIKYEEVFEGLKKFSMEFKGQLWIEFMMVKGLNDSKESVDAMKKQLYGIDYERIYINTPVRPPAEDWVEVPELESVEYAVKKFNGISIDHLASPCFSSSEKDDYEAIMGIIGRHPMNQHEIKSFLSSREAGDKEEIMSRLRENEKVEVVEYKGYMTYRLV